MSVKLIGGLFLVGSGILTSLLAARQERRKLALLEGWISLLIHIRTQIDCYLATLGDILSALPRDLLSACLCEDKVSSPEELLEKSAPLLDKETYTLLSEFVREVGGCYREEQLRRCDHYISALEAIRQRRKAELPARVKLTRTLCICLPLGMAILLW